MMGVRQPAKPVSNGPCPRPVPSRLQLTGAKNSLANDDITPRATPAPHLIKAPTAQPSVPEVTILFDQGSCVPHGPRGPCQGSAQGRSQGPPLASVYGPTTYNHRQYEVRVPDPVVTLHSNQVTSGLTGRHAPPGVYCANNKGPGPMDPRPNGRGPGPWDPESDHRNHPRSTRGHEYQYSNTHIHGASANPIGTLPESAYHPQRAPLGSVPARTYPSDQGPQPHGSYPEPQVPQAYHQTGPNKGQAPRREGYLSNPHQRDPAPHNPLQRHPSPHHPPRRHPAPHNPPRRYPQALETRVPGSHSTGETYRHGACQGPPSNGPVYSQGPPSNGPVYSQGPPSNGPVYSQGPPPNGPVYSQGPNARYSPSKQLDIQRQQYQQGPINTTVREGNFPGPDPVSTNSPPGGMTLSEAMKRLNIRLKPSPSSTTCPDPRPQNGSGENGCGESGNGASGPERALDSSGEGTTISGDVYQLLVTQDSQIRNLKEQVERLLARQDNTQTTVPMATKTAVTMTNLPSVTMATQTSLLEKFPEEKDGCCSVGINTSFMFPGGSVTPPGGADVTPGGEGVPKPERRTTIPTVLQTTGPGQAKQPFKQLEKFKLPASRAPQDGQDISERKQNRSTRKQGSHNGIDKSPSLDNTFQNSLASLDRGRHGNSPDAGSRGHHGNSPEASPRSNHDNALRHGHGYNCQPGDRRGQSPRMPLRGSYGPSSRHTSPGDGNESYSLGEIQLSQYQGGTEESIMSEMMVDLPAYTSLSPHKSSSPGDLADSEGGSDSRRGSDSEGSSGSPGLGESVSMYEGGFRLYSHKPPAMYQQDFTAPQGAHSPQGDCSPQGARTSQGPHSPQGHGLYQPDYNQDQSQAIQDDTLEHPLEDNEDTGYGESAQDAELLLHNQTNFYRHLIGNVKKFLANHSGDVDLDETGGSEGDLGRSGDTGVDASPQGSAESPQPSYNTGGWDIEDTKGTQPLGVNKSMDFTRTQLAKLGIHLDSSSLTPSQTPTRGGQRGNTPSHTPSHTPCRGGQWGGGDLSMDPSASDQSTFLLDQAFLPRVEYVSMLMTEDSDLSACADALAIKYLNDQQLSELAKMRREPGGRGPGTPGGTTRGIGTPGGKVVGPNTTLADPLTHMSFASRKYMERHGLIEAEVGGHDREEEDSAMDLVNVTALLHRLTNTSYMDQDNTTMGDNNTTDHDTTMGDDVATNDSTNEHSIPGQTVFPTTHNNTTQNQTQPRQPGLSNSYNGALPCHRRHRNKHYHENGPHNTSHCQSYDSCSASSTSGSHTAEPGHYHSDGDSRFSAAVPGRPADMAAHHPYLPPGAASSIPAHKTTGCQGNTAAKPYRVFDTPPIRVFDNPGHHDNQRRDDPNERLVVREEKDVGRVLDIGRLKDLPKLL